MVAIADRPNTKTKDLLLKLQYTRMAYRNVNDRMFVRRNLVSRIIGDNLTGNGTGTNVIAPYDEQAMLLRPVLGEPSEAVQNYTGRLTGNAPVLKVTPINSKPAITKTMGRTAGEEERLHSELFREACAVSGGEGEYQRAGQAMVLGGVAYVLTLPRDLAFGLPDRIYYPDLSDDEIGTLVRQGELAPSRVAHPRTGQMVYAESADLWANRRKEAMKQNKVAGRGLFMLRALPRDMVLREKDLEGLKWGAVVEEVPSTGFGPGTPWAMAAARNDSTYEGAPEDYSLTTNAKGEIIGGLTVGGPLGYYAGINRPTSFTFITCVDREDLVYLVCGPNDVVGGKEIWRGKHGAMIGGQPVCPLVEIPCVRGDIDLPDYEFMTPLDQLFGIIPSANQLLTLRSNVGIFNGTPRFVATNVDQKFIDAAEEGEPSSPKSAPTPGLDPTQIAMYPGDVVPIQIPAEDLNDAIKIMLDRIDHYMPAQITEGAAGANAPAWQVHQLIKQAQTKLDQPAKNLAYGITQIHLMWNGWMRQLDVPVVFWSAPGHRKDQRDSKYLIEFDPKDLTDSIEVSIDLNSGEDLIVLDQVGQAKLRDGLITREEYMEVYAREPDAYAATVQSYGQIVADSMLLTPQQGQPQLGPVLQMVRDRVMGRLAVELTQWSPNAARATAKDMTMQAQQAGMMAGSGQQPTPIVAGGGDVSLANAAGQRAPGIGMAQTLPQQMGVA